MKIQGKDKKALWFEKNILYMYDQRKLPNTLEVFTAKTVDDVDYAIKTMVIRGAPAIGAAAVYGMVLGQKEIEKTAEQLRKTRPTAYDLFYAIDYMLKSSKIGKDLIVAADDYVEDIIDRCRRIGEHGNTLIKDKMNILTHCNAGALATVDYGTALAPFRIAKKSGKNIFIYADETRPRLQGLLTSWELSQEEIPHAVIADNAAGYYMKNGDIDMVITGADRIAKNGDFANKIGTYEKAVLAKENNIPFYVAAPVSTFDNSIETGDEIVIEQRSSSELKTYNNCTFMKEQVPVKNPAFDVTPKKYVKGYITEDGVKTI
ncbi:MAG: S-methyl-5-thioribose-1-phosphate isomerase [Thermoplasmata archaeon]|nr:MAG: S-methyl-5-thioribose-1-phosphate isomerase [Thermoplasmata archaeon]